MKFSDLNLKINKEKNITKIEDHEIEVLQYLPIEDKIDLIDITLQKSEENGTYNEIKLEKYFNLYIVYMYTNLEFTDEEKMNESELYDKLECSDVFINIIGAMDENEYKILYDYLVKMRSLRQKYHRSAASLLQAFIQDLPKNAAAASQIVDNFDKERYKEVVDFAQAANGGRPI